jgi:glycine cleavage system H protein
VIPENLKYPAEHEWVQTGDGNRVRVGNTHYAQDALGDVVFVQLPEVGAAVTAGQACGEVESTKSVSEIYAPLSGEVLARNEALDARPDLVNQDPYGEGWLIDIAITGGDAVDGLLDAKAYGELTAQT